MEEIGIENILETQIMMTAVRMVKTMVMRPAMNGDSGTYEGFSGGGFSIEECCNEKLEP